MYSNITFLVSVLTLINNPRIRSTGLETGCDLSCLSRHKDPFSFMPRHFCLVGQTEEPKLFKRGCYKT